MKAGFWAWYADRLKQFPSWLMGKLRGLKLDPIVEKAVGITGFYMSALGGFCILVLGAGFSDLVKGYSVLFGTLLWASMPFWVTVYYHGKWRGQR